RGVSGNSGSRVLIVDDAKASIDLLVHALREDYLISIALDGENALQIARKAKPDLILLDINLPGMSGRDVCKRLATDEATSNIPVIIQTDMTGTQDEVSGLGLGAVDYITKPYNIDLLRIRVRNHIELKRHRDDLERL